MASISTQVWILTVAVALFAMHTAAEPEAKPCEGGKVGTCPMPPPTSTPGWVIPDGARAGPSTTPSPAFGQPPIYPHVPSPWGNSGSNMQRVYYVPQISCHITGYVPQSYPLYYNQMAPSQVQPMPFPQFPAGTVTDTMAGSGSGDGMHILPYPYYPNPQPQPEVSPLNGFSGGQVVLPPVSGGQGYHRPAVQPTPAPAFGRPTTERGTGGQGHSHGSHGSNFGAGTSGSSSSGGSGSSVRGRSHSDDSQQWRNNY